MKKIFTAAVILSAFAFVPSAFAAATDYSHYWNFEEGMGRSVNDSVGGQNGVMVGTSTGFGWASGKIGSSLGMDGGAGTGVALPDAFLKGSQGSISLWVDPLTLSDSNIIFSGKSTSDNNIYAALAIDRDGRPQLQFRDSASGADRKAQGTHLLNRNEWVNLVLTASGQSYHMYINGIEAPVAGDNIGRWFPDITNQALSYRIGTLTANPMNGSFNGYLDDLKIYDRVLTQDEVTALFNEGNAGRPTIPAGVAAKAMLTISDDHVPYGGSVALNWTSVNSDSCSASGSWNGAMATSGSMVFAKLATDASYTLSCSNKYGADSSTVHVAIGTSTPTTGGGITVTPVVTTTPPPITTMPLQFSANLTVGSRGDAVVNLQNFLVAKGYLGAGLSTGYFGMLTKAAVVKFQAGNGVPATGYVGPLTRAALNSAK